MPDAAQHAGTQPGHGRLWPEYSDQPTDGYEPTKCQTGDGERHIIQQRNRNAPARSEIPRDGAHRQSQRGHGHGDTGQIDDGEQQ